MSNSPLTAWESFYIIVGSAAGVLTGLMFVAVTLVAGRRVRGASWAMLTFNTPIVVHLGMVLFACALLIAPWSALTPPALLLGLAGLGGVAYGIIVVRRMRRRVSYQPVREDWLWYAIVPLAAYTALVVAALLLPGSPVPALFGIGAVLLLLVFVGLHNAWDAVTYIAVELGPQQPAGDEQRAADEEANT
jgi:hypothetical protein